MTALLFPSPAISYAQTRYSSLSPTHRLPNVWYYSSVRVSGTEIGHAATRSTTEKPDTDTLGTVLSAYARARPCPVLTLGMFYLPTHMLYDFGTSG
eukprot:2843438-Rhodomonas_salina.3